MTYTQILSRIRALTDTKRQAEKRGDMMQAEHCDALIADFEQRITQGEYL